MAPDSDSHCIKTLLKEISVLGQGRRKLVVAGPWPITKDHSCGSWYNQAQSDTRSRFTVEAWNGLDLGSSFLAEEFCEHSSIYLTTFGKQKSKLKYQPSTRLDSSFKSVHYITIYSPHLLDWFWFLPTFFTLLFASSLQHRQLEVDSVPLNPPTSKADVFADFSAKR